MLLQCAHVKKKHLCPTRQAQEGGTTYTVSNKYTGGTATEYVSPSTGEFVVVDNGTKQVIQVSRHDFLPNHLVK
jgi:hypothetical protein